MITTIDRFIDIFTTTLSFALRDNGIQVEPIKNGFYIPKTNNIYHIEGKYSYCNEIFVQTFKNNVEINQFKVFYQSMETNIDIIKSQITEFHWFATTVNKIIENEYLPSTRKRKFSELSVDSDSEVENE